MSQSEFHGAGLDKLNPEELKALDDWLREGASAPTYITPAGSPVFYPKESEREVVESRIPGRFTGWYGQNVFALENGQEWKQAQSGASACAIGTKIKIKPMLLGSWLAYIETCRDSVRVERVK